ncbi:hypothetical protein GCM10028821_49560 [Hymenobacter jeollabukensis]
MTAAPTSELEICVIIPAKDEADALPTTLAALAAQLDAEGQPLSGASYEVIVLANNCTDATAAVARAAGQRHPHLRLHVLEISLPRAEAHVGRARRLLMDEAARRLELAGRPRGIIASTDADTRVAPDWLTALQREFAAGADAVGGRILPDAPTTAGCPARRLHLHDAAYRLGLARLEHLLDPSAADPWPRHHQHFGGSLALTVAAYRQVGGLPVVPYLEDEALCQLLLRHELRLRHSPLVRVHTSARQQGRVAVGLSWQLRVWADDAAAGREPWAEHPQRLAAEWQLRRQLRRAWQQGQAGLPIAPADLRALAAELATTPGRLRQLLRTASFGTTWDALRPAAIRRWQAQWSPLPLTAARASLRQLLRAAEASAAGQQIEPVRFRPVAVQVAQRAGFGGWAQKMFVHFVAGQRVIVYCGRPVHQQQLPARRQGCDDQVGGALQRGHIPVVAHFRQHNQVELPGRKLLRHGHAAQLHLRQAGAALPGFGQGRLRHVDAEQVAAARSQLRRQHAQGAADFEGAGVVRLRQGGQRVGVLGVLVGAGFEVPGVVVGAVHVVEIVGT